MQDNVFEGHESNVEIESHKVNEEATQDKPETGIVEEVQNRYTYPS